MVANLANHPLQRMRTGKASEHHHARGVLLQRADARQWRLDNVRLQSVTDIA